MKIISEETQILNDTHQTKDVSRKHSKDSYNKARNLSVERIQEKSGISMKNSKIIKKSNATMT